MPVTRPSALRLPLESGAGSRRLLFLVLMAAMVLAVATAPLVLIRPLLDATAELTAGLLGLLGIESRQLGNFVYLDQGALLITRDCTGLYLMAIFAALVLSYPASWRSRLIALAWGFPALALLNVVRLVTAGLVLHWYPDAFSLVHDFVFQVLLVISVLVLWLVWIGRLREKGG